MQHRKCQNGATHETDGRNREMIRVLLGLVLLSLSCHDFGTSPDLGGVGIIIPGKSIDGVLLGDSKDVVLSKLGTPDGKGWADGIWRSWLTYAYQTGSHAGMTICFAEADPGVYGPVDMLIIDSTYRGKTHQGVAMGGHLSLVRQIYGAPIRTISWPGSGYLQDVYCFGETHQVFGYKDSAINGMSIGYFYPMKQDTLYDCR